MASIERKIKITLPNEYETVSALFNDFYDRNKQFPFFSYRYLAQNLQWPVSYFKEVQTGKRNLSVLRAIQFSKFLNYSPFELEALILLSIKDSFVENNQEEAFSKVFGAKRGTLHKEKKEKGFIYNHRTITVWSIICFKQGRVSPEEVVEITSLYDWSLHEVKQSFSFLEKEGYIEKANNGHYKVFVRKLILDEESDGQFKGLDLHRQSALGFINFCDNPTKSSCYNTGTIVIPKNKFNEVGLKIVALRNWLVEYSKENSIETIDEEDLIYQFNLNLVPLVKFE